MPLRTLSLVVLALTCLLSGASSMMAQPTSIPAEAPKADLTLDECIERALKRNFDLEITHYSTLNAREAVEVSRSLFDPSFFASTSRLYSKSPTSNSVLNGASRPISDSENTRVGLTQTVPTGGTYSLYSNLGRSYSNSSFSIVNPAYNSALTLSVSQPLLQGAGLFVNRAPIEINKLNLKIANLTYKSQALGIIQNTENAYNNLVFAREQQHVRELSLDTATRVYNENKTRRTTGVATDLDVITAEVGVATAKSNLVTAQQSVKDNQDALLALIGQFELDAAIGVPHFTDVTEAVPSFDSSYKMALDNDPDFLSTRASIQQSEISVRVAKRGRLPSLSVGGQIGLAGLRGTAYDSYDQLAKDEGYVWGLNVQLSVPLGNRGPNAQLREAFNTLSQSNTRLRQLEQQVLVSVRSAVRTVETNIQSVSLASTAAQLSERQFQLTKAKLDAGLSTTRELQQARDDLDTARINELQAKVTLRSALAALHRLEGSSFEHYHIALTEVK